MKFIDWLIEDLSEFTDEFVSEDFLDEARTGRISPKKSKDISLLDTYICSIIFRKVDGTIRRMKGTRNLKYIPVVDHPNGNGYPKIGVKPVYDLKLKAWRSFRISNIMQCVRWFSDKKAK